MQDKPPCLALPAAPKKFLRLRPRMLVIVDEFPRMCRNILVCIDIFITVLDRAESYGTFVTFV